MYKSSKSTTFEKLLRGTTSNVKGLFAWWPTYRKSKMGVAGLIVFILLVMSIIIAPMILDKPAMSFDTWFRPSRAHLLGTDASGKDLFAYLFYAGRWSLLVGTITAFMTNFIGTVIGLIAGYFGGWIDELFMRFADVLVILPSLPLLIILAEIMGPGLLTIVFIISFTRWTSMARQIRAMALSLREYQYVESTKAIGAGSFHIVIRHILPNVLGIVFSHFVMSVINIILLETGLAFLGFGDPLRPSWGQMLHNAEANGAFSSGAWWWWFPPGLCITILCASMAFIGMTLNDRFVLRIKRGGRA